MSLAFKQICSVTNFSEVSEHTTAHEKAGGWHYLDFHGTHLEITTEIHLVDEQFMEKELGKTINYKKKKKIDGLI